MGLDQYAYAVMPNRENTDFSIAWSRDEQDAGKVRKIAQWRKHSDLQGWVERLWLRKMEEQGIAPKVSEGGWFAGEVVFNCQPVRLTLADLAQLEEDVNAENLPHTTGFFFGQSYPEDRLDDLAFIEEARQAIAMDMEIYYDSWW